MVHVIQVCCQDDQPLLIGLFYEGKYGWTISTAELLQCHAYTPCILVIMTPPGCKLTDICAPNRHYTIIKDFALPSKKIQENSKKIGAQDSLKGAASLPTQLSPNRTASLASPSAKEKYTHKHGGPDEPDTQEISPTAPWTDTSRQHMPHQGAMKQMPLLRRTSDKVLANMPQNAQQADANQKNLKLMSQPTTPPIGQNVGSHLDDDKGLKGQGQE